MYNLKRGGGTYKGIVGECLFKLTRRYLILPKFFNKEKYFKIFGERLSKDEANFIDNNWHSLDAIEFDYTKNPRKVVLFEVKTLNDVYYHKLNGLNRIPIFTDSSVKMYKGALQNGFDVRVAKVWLKDDWNYDVEIVDFDKCNYQIDSPKKYDKNSATFPLEK
jgi:hypothetical protein